MTLQEIIEALRSLDKLYEQKDSFHTWLTADTQAASMYEQVKQRIEESLPGFRVAYVDLTYRMGHALVPID